jgi:quercetin dioxygenase-like cupin family protein
MTRAARDIGRFPVHLGLGARAVPQPEFTGLEWYQSYGERIASDGMEGRLVSMHTFASNWTSWENHPKGDEVVLCVGGEITVVQELPEGRFHSETIQAGEYLINPAGVWHTADIPHSATVVFITAGEGTQHRDR